MTIGLLKLAPALLGRRLVAVTVRGSSMEPTYRDGDNVLVRRDLPPRPGLVVVVEQPVNDAEWHHPPVPPAASRTTLSSRAWMIKRVTAIGGDPLPRKEFPALTRAPEGLVPRDKIVLRGDNPTASYDSRQAGYFPTERVLGVVWTAAVGHQVVLRIRPV